MGKGFLTRLAAVIFLSWATVVSCKKEASYLSVEPQSLEFESSAGSQTIAVSCGSDWTCSSTTGWIKAEKRDGSLLVKADANDSGETRSGNVNVNSDDGLHAEVTVTQKQNDVVSISGQSVITISSEAQNIEVMLSSNVPYQFSTDADWITLNTTKTLSEEHVILSIAAQKMRSRRQGLVYFSSESGVKASMLIYQNGPEGVLSVGLKDVSSWTAPLVQGVGFTGTVEWGDGSDAEEYSANLRHNYKEQADYEFKISGSSLSKVSFNNLIGIKTIDFTAI